MTARIEANFRANLADARNRNISSHAEISIKRLELLKPKPPIIKPQFPRLPELMTADDLVDHLTATECRETLRQILRAVQAADRRGPDKAMAAMGEAIADAATWAEEMMVSA